MSDYTFRRALRGDGDAVIDFLNRNWGSRHPLVNLPDYFTYYYRNGDPQAEQLNFLLCLAGDAIAAVCGYIPASQSGEDIWISIWCADRCAKGSGLELMSRVLELTGAKRMSCNNIRPNTIPFYEFLGYTGARMGHFYRLAPRPDYRVARVKTPVRLPVGGSGALRPLADAAALRAAFAPPANAVPHKDLWYLTRRYFAYPRQKYLVYGGFLGGQCPLLFCLRRVEVCGTAVLRLVDIVGDRAQLPQFGAALDALLTQQDAEYIDCYCAGVPAALMAAAGFCERPEQSGEVLIPHYLTPPLFENVEYYYFTSVTEDFAMFRADGDQDRPNLQC